MSKKTQDTSNASAAMAGDALAASQDTINALRQASALCLDAYGQIGASYLAYLRNATDFGMTAATAVLAAKSVHGVMDVQIGFAQQRYDDFLAEGTKISELSIKTANEARALLRKRFEDNFARFVQTPSV